MIVKLSLPLLKGNTGERKTLNIRFKWKDPFAKLVPLKKTPKQAGRFSSSGFIKKNDVPVHLLRSHAPADSAFLSTWSAQRIGRDVLVLVIYPTRWASDNIIPKFLKPTYYHMGFSMDLSEITLHWAMHWLLGDQRGVMDSSSFIWRKQNERIMNFKCIRGIISLLSLPVVAFLYFCYSLHLDISNAQTILEAFLFYSFSSMHYPTQFSSLIIISESFKVLTL